MKILVSGCSFTHWPAEPGSDKNICWPAYLQKSRADLEIHNRAEPAAGNQYIANSVVSALCDRPAYYDMVLVMWSGVSRIDFLTDVSHAEWNTLFDDYGFYRRVESCPSTLGYIFSGGQMGPWYQNYSARSVFSPLYKVSSNLSLAHANLIEIIKCQEFLKARNVPYRFMSYVNYWTTEGYMSPNGDFGVLAFPELKALIAQIDFCQWIFSDDKRNGIYEMAKSAEDYHGDRFHPGAETNRRWAEIVIQRLPTP